MKIAKRFLVCLAALLTTAGFVQARTIVVDDDNVTGPWNGSEEYPYQYIQDGINAASGRDTVLVWDGTYKGPGNVNLDFKGKFITVESKDGPSGCIIDCENTSKTRGFYFHSGETGSVVDGFTIQNGFYDMGGAIYCINASSPTIKHCIIYNNTATYGGGIYCKDSSPVITNSTITENTAWSAGGIYCENSSSVITSNTITKNTVTMFGGGVYCYNSSPTITNNTIKENSADTLAGGIFCNSTGPTTTIEGNTIQDNTTLGGGGGLYFNASSPLVENNIVTGNEASYGGGICSFSNPVITGNTISSNLATDYGGGIYSKGNPEITSNVINNNEADKGGGICCWYSSPEITGNIIKNNTGNGGSAIFCEGSSSEINNNLVTGNDDNASVGGTIYCKNSSGLEIMSNTITGNTVTSGAGGFYCCGSTLTIDNTILWNNNVPEIYYCPPASGGSSKVTIAYSAIQGETFGIVQNSNGTLTYYTSNTGSDPMFKDPVNGDYHLTLGSPCIGTGAMFADTPTTDIEGNPRPNPVGSNPDMGAYESPLSGLPDIMVSPAPWDYGNVSLGSYSDRTFVVTNTGSKTLIVTATSITGHSDFAVQSGGGNFSLSPGGKRNVVVRFTPAALGARSATLGFVNNVVGKSPMNVSLAGNGVPTPAPDIEVNPASWNYGDVALGNHSEKVFTVTNPGTSMLDVTATNLTGNSDFTFQTGNGSFSLYPGEIHEIVIRFTPAQLFVRTATLSLINNVSGSNPLNVGLTGNGMPTPVPDIAIIPTSHNYGDVGVGNYTEKVFVVSNPGSGMLDVTATNVVGDSDFSIGLGGGGFSLNPGEIHEILVRFIPGSEGQKSASLVLQNNVAGSNPLEALLWGNGTAIPKPDIVVEPGAWNYGELAMGFYLEKVFTVFNPGNELLSATSTSIIGDSSFNIQTGGGSFNLLPGAIHEILVRFGPASTGGKSAVLRLENNVTSKNPMDVPLEGVGVAAPNPDIAVEPPSWSYGDVEVGLHSDRFFVISNPGSGTLNVSATDLTGDSSFTIELGGGGFSLNPGEIREILVRFFPQSTGQKTATLSLVNNVTGKNPLNVALNGTGVALNPDIEVVPDPWNYGEVRIGTSSELIFTVLSSGTGMLKVNGVNIIDNNNFTIEAGGGSFDLPPGGIREVLVRFSPQSAGIKNANLRFETNVADKNPLNVSLEGTGVLPEEKDIEVNPPSWSYGDVPVGAQFDKIFVVANTGIGIVEVTSTTLIGSNEFSIQFGGGGFNLGPGQVREILIRFAPQSGGFKYSVLSLANNVSGKNPLEVPLHGNGIPSGFSIRMATGWSLLSFPVNKCFFEGTPPTDQPACVELVDVEDLGFTTLADWFTSVLTSENPVDPPWRIVIGSDGAMDSTIDPMFHSLKHMSPISGCWVKIKTEAGETTLTLNGSLYDPDCAIPLPVGWELVGYPLTTGYYDMEPEPDTPGITWTRVDPPAAEYVFRSIDNQYRIIIGADGAYDPTINIIFNSLHYIGPGDAFWVKTYQAVNLVYGNMGTGTESLAAVPGRRQVVTKRGVTPTSTFMIIYGEVTRDDIALEAGNRVQVFTQTGTLCGDFTVEHTGLYGMMLVYGDEPYTPEVEGARSGEGLIFYVNGRPAGTGREIYWCDSKPPEHVDLAYYSLPEVSMLDQNYPNPLNPDTWIPYQLKEEARVQIRIYTTTGQLVRTLNLGQKPAGFYTDKSRAAYWDGRNEAGESVASGIYFYSITAGDYTATKKMTVMR